MQVKHLLLIAILAMTAACSSTKEVVDENLSEVELYQLAQKDLDNNSYTSATAKLKALEVALNVNDVSVMRLIVQELVSGYVPSDDIVDWVYLEQEAEAQALGVGALQLFEQVDRVGTLVQRFAQLVEVLDARLASIAPEIVGDPKPPRPRTSNVSPDAVGYTSMETLPRISRSSRAWRRSGSVPSSRSSDSSSSPRPKCASATASPPSAMPLISGLKASTSS